MLSFAASQSAYKFFSLLLNRCCTPCLFVCLFVLRKLSLFNLASLVILQAWSITYHSWLTFVLLLWACAIWIIPAGTTRQRALYTSPFLVFYAECLLCLQFVYGLNLTDDELPTEKGHVNLKELGLVKYTYPCFPLGVQVCSN